MSSIPIPIMLLPLRVGTIIASCVARRITTDTKVTLKWPNDILIDAKKVGIFYVPSIQNSAVYTSYVLHYIIISRQACGVLIEMEGDMILIGIGCNVMSAPVVNATTNNANASLQIRPATCIAEHNAEYAEAAARRRQLFEQSSATTRASLSGTSSSSDNNNNSGSGSSSTSGGSGSDSCPTALTLSADEHHKALAVEICDNLFDWITSRTDTAALVLRDFTDNMDYSPQRLRDEPNEAVGIVLPTGLNPDGTLKVSMSARSYIFLV